MTKLFDSIVQEIGCAATNKEISAAIISAVNKVREGNHPGKNGTAEQHAQEFALRAALNIWAMAIVTLNAIVESAAVAMPDVIDAVGSQKTFRDLVLLRLHEAMREEEPIKLDEAKQ